MPGPEYNADRPQDDEVADLPTEPQVVTEKQKSPLLPGADEDDQAQENDGKAAPESTPEDDGK